MPDNRFTNDPLGQRLYRIYEDALEELQYPAYRFLGKLRRDGGVKAAKYYLRPSPNVTQGFRRLLEHDRLDLSVEAVALEPQWHSYFTAEELMTARERLARFGYFSRHEARSTNSDQLSPDELVDSEKYPEGTCIQISVSAYERNAEARAKCIDHYGAICFVCGFDFERTYGEELGHGRIHVHHLTPFAAQDGVRETEPIVDLRPVCPNCHWMLHRRNPPISIAELKGIMSSVRAKQPRAK